MIAESTKSDKAISLPPASAPLPGEGWEEKDEGRKGAEAD